MVLHICHDYLCCGKLIQKFCFVWGLRKFLRVGILHSGSDRGNRFLVMHDILGIRLESALDGAHPRAMTIMFQGHLLTKLANGSVCGGMHSSKLLFTLFGSCLRGLTGVFRLFEQCCTEVFVRGAMCLCLGCLLCGSFLNGRCHCRHFCTHFGPNRMNTSARPRRDTRNGDVTSIHKSLPTKDSCQLCIPDRESNDATSHMLRT